MPINILIVITAFIVLLAVVVSLRPSDFKVIRSAAIAAPPEAVFPHVNDLHSWEAWSPWMELDPAAKKTYTGPASGVGASFAWEGNNKIGAGSMTITESHPYELIRFKLDFLKPFKGTNVAEFTFKPDGAKTQVTWAMTGKLNFLTKIFHLIVNCDDMVGGQFEKGLDKLNRAAAQVATK